MSRVYWDSLLFVYWLEDHPQQGERVNQIREKMHARGDSICTSVFTVGEVLAGVYKRGEFEMAAQIRKAFNSPEIDLIPFRADTADRFGQLRAKHNITPADAIHLASASDFGVDLFLTNDHRLQSLNIPGIQFIAGMDVNIF